MRKLHVLQFFAKGLVCLTIIAVLFNSCKKEAKSNEPKTTDQEIATKKPGTNKYPGPCPYPCDDPACKAYSDYCGGSTQQDNISLTTIQSPTDYNDITSQFQNLNVTLTDLSNELGLSYILSANDVDFQNLSRSYITNDDGVGEAIVAPFKTNSSNNITNYAFCMTVDANNIYKPFIIQSATDQYLKFFDLNEGYILTINNYNNADAVTYQTTIGSYMTNPSNGNARAASCGQATIDCVVDAYSNHGWVSVWAFVQTAFIPHTAAAIAGACAVKNCLPRSNR
jgi:hypothetical protein